MSIISIHYFHEDSICTYEYTYPSPLELLSIFPEAKEKDIIPRKLREWRRAKRSIEESETIPYFTKCNALSDKFTSAFWKECYRYLAGGYNEICSQLTRLERLHALCIDPEGHRSRAAAIERAKATPINDLHSFEHMRRVGRYYVATCPIHREKAPSLRIYPNNTWYCFGCARGGDAIDFVRILHGIDFNRAVDYITKGPQ